MTPRPKFQWKNYNAWWNVAAMVLLAGTATVLLASPSFPSEDGPVHLYYVDILRSLLAHHGTYSQYFQLKTPLTPYVLEYYSLLALESVFPPLVSEKLLLCGYIALFGAGFKCLVEAVTGDQKSPWTLVGIPFCMNMLVYLGFLNYCLGIALTLLLSGLWIRYSARLNARRIAVLLAGFALILLAHPIALGVFLLFIGLHFLVDWSLAAASDSNGWLRALRDRRLALATIVSMGIVSLGWIGLFVDTANRAPLLPNYVSRLGLVNAVLSELSLSPVSPFTSPLYCDGLLLLVGATALILVVRPWKQGGRWRGNAVALFAASMICFALYCFAPPKLNSTWYFPERFPIFGVLFLIPAAAALRPSPRCSAVTGALAFCVTLGVIGMQWIIVSSIGQKLRPVLQAPLAQAGSTGLIIAPPKVYPAGLSFDPYGWSGVHYVRRSKAILANEPWMDQTHIMLQPIRTNPWSFLDGDAAGVHMADVLHSGEQPKELDFVVQSGLDAPDLFQLVYRIGLTRFAEDSQFVRLYRRPSPDAEKVQNHVPTHAAQ